MDTLQWKVEKIAELDNEVREVHPVLKDLFLKMPSIKTAHYTHGNQEMGADFVLVREDEVLLQERYIGVIVKATEIKQDHSDLKRQIEECEVERPVEGGKKKIFITEIWVITTKNITRNAQEKLHKDFKTTNLIFIDGEKLAKLIDTYNSAYWDYETSTLGNYVVEQVSKIKALSQAQNLLPKTVVEVILEQRIFLIEKQKKNKFRVQLAPKSTTLIDELDRKKAIFIEGGMGSGKSELLRRTARSLLTSESLRQTPLLPFFASFRELKDTYQFDCKTVIKLIRESSNNQNKTIVLFVDGMDEVADDNAQSVSSICSFANELLCDDGVKLVVSSRHIDEPSARSEIEKSFDCFAMAPLQFGNLIAFIQQICQGKLIPDKFRSDMQNSQLLKALPRTPLSAILLAKLISENIQHLPSTLPELYSKYTELVLGRWDLNKGNGSEKEYETIYRLTATLATYMLSNDIEVLATSELREIFKDYLIKRHTGQDLDALLNNFIARSEIVSHDKENKTIRFRHRSFSEYFFAQNLYWSKGREAPLSNPFDPRWTAVEYFYLGLIKDAPERITALSAFVPNDERTLFTKIHQFGSYLLAAYQTPYETISTALYRIFADTAKLYCEIVSGRESPLANLPELQLLAFCTSMLRETYAYDFFDKALGHAKIQLQLDLSLTSDEKLALEFLLDAVLAKLGSIDAFVRLVDENEKELKWAIRMGITCAAADVSMVNEATKRIEKKNRKWASTNKSLQHYLNEIQSVPINTRAKLVGSPKAPS